MNPSGSMGNAGETAPLLDSYGKSKGISSRQYGSIESPSSTPDAPARRAPEHKSKRQKLWMIAMVFLLLCAFELLSGHRLMIKLFWGGSSNDKPTTVAGRKSMPPLESC
jgi:hypothetical protein